ncbi:MAG: sigma-70 family RNA polymerase sigma factor [Bdellovibrionaceae bacterium]|nr:sigma-70 family RNA polymerase sigma factor [Pseudobdellovibrionaceae bacterium]
MAANIMPLNLFKERRVYLVEDHSFLLNKIATEQCVDSFNIIFLHYAPKIFRYGLANHLTDSLASDLVQEVMTLIWTKSNYFSEEKGEVSTWIFTLARNLRFDILRIKSRESKILSAEDIWPQNATTEFIDLDADLEKINFYNNIRHFVEQLPTSQRDVVIEVYFCGLTQEQYAAQKKIPLGTVKSRIRLAIRKLNNLLEAK